MVQKMLREVEADTKSRSNSEGAAKAKKWGMGPKKSAKEETPDAPTVSWVAAGKLQPPMVRKAPADLSEMVIPSPNWPKHSTPPGPEFRGCAFCL